MIVAKVQFSLDSGKLGKASKGQQIATRDTKEVPNEGKGSKIQSEKTAVDVKFKVACGARQDRIVDHRDA